MWNMLIRTEIEQDIECWLINRGHYGLEIKDLQQPLLIHRPKRRARDPDPSRQEEVSKYIVHCSISLSLHETVACFVLQPLPLICLVPELCHMTGLLDSDRADFRVMKVRKLMVRYRCMHMSIMWIHILFVVISITKISKQAMLVLP